MKNSFRPLLCGQLYFGSKPCNLLTRLHSHMNGKINNQVPFNRPATTKIFTKWISDDVIGKIHLDGKMRALIAQVLPSGVIIINLYLLPIQEHIK